MVAVGEASRGGTARPEALPPLIPRAALSGSPARATPQRSPDGRNVLRVWLLVPASVKAAPPGNPPAPG
jgi:hypothetical protein